MKKTVISIITVLILIILAGLWYWHKHSSSKMPAALPPTYVKVQKVIKHNIPLRVHAVGQLIAPETIMLKAKQPGEITGIFFKNGQYVKKGQLLLQIDDTAEKALLTKQMANYIDIKTQYDRYKRLEKRAPESVSADTLAQKLGALKVAEAQVAAARKAYNDTRIVAPFSGRIGSLQSTVSTYTVAGQQLNQTTQLSVGTYLQVGSPIAILSNQKNVVVQYQVAQSYSQQLKLNQPVTVTSSAFPNMPFNGTVTFISPVVLESSQAFNVRAKISNDQSMLHSGMNVFVTQTLQQNRQILAIPGISLVPSLTGYDVYTIVKGKVKATPVTIGQRYGTWVAVKSGLKAGDEIIVTGIEKVHPGSAVTTKKPVAKKSK